MPRNPKVRKPLVKRVTIEQYDYSNRIAIMLDSEIVLCTINNYIRRHPIAHIPKIGKIIQLNNFLKIREIC